MKKHELKLTVKVHKVTLSVKFPCKLCLYLKTQSQEEHIASQVALQNGQGLVEKEHVSHCVAEFNSRTNVYRDKKIMLIIYLKSSSGKIPAGNATVDLNSLKIGPNKIQSNILKCPDKSASVSMSINVQVQRQQQAQNDNQDAKSHSSYRNQYQSSPRSLQQPNRMNYTISKQLNESKLSVQDTRPFHYRNNSQRTPLNNNYVKKVDYENNHSKKGHYANNYVKKSDGQSIQKISQLQRDKSQMMRQIKIIKQNLRQEPFTPRDNSRQKIKQLQKQIESQKDKMSQAQLELTKKNYKENELHRDNQSLQRKLDKLLLELTQQKSKKQSFQKTSKDLELQLKLMKDKLQDLELTNENLHKKMQFKENVLKEQLKSVSDKFSLSESEKQRMLIDKNDLIVEFEEKERAVRVCFREKEKVWNEQKTKLFKQIEALNNSGQLLKQNSQDQESLVKQLREELKAAKKQKQQLAQQLNDERQLLSQQRIKLSQHVQTKAESQSLQQQMKKVELEVKKSRKLLGEREQQILRLQQQVSNCKSMNEKLAKKAEESEHSLKEKLAQKKILQREYEAASRQVEKARKEQQSMGQKMNDITFANQNKTSQFALLNEQLHEKDRRYQDEMAHISDELTRKNLQLSQVIAQLQQSREHESGIGSQLVQLQRQIQQARTLVNHKYIQNQNLKAQLQEVREKNECVQRQRRRLEQRVSETQKLLSQGQQGRQAQCLAMQLKVNEAEKRVKFLSETSSSESQIWRGRIQKLEQLVSRKDGQLKELRVGYTDLQTEIIQREGEFSELEHEMKLKLNEVDFLKEQLTQTRKELADKIADAQNLSMGLERKEEELFESRQKIQQLTQTICESRQKIQQLTQTICKVQGQSSAQSSEFSEYKSVTQRCLKHFFAKLNSQQQTPSTHPSMQLLKHDQSQQITNSILESLNNKNAYLANVNAQFTKSQSTIDDLSSRLKTQTYNNVALQQKVQLLQQAKQQLEKAKQQLEKAKEQLEKCLSLEANGLKLASEQWQQQQTSLQNNIHSLTQQTEALEKQLIQCQDKLLKQKSLKEKSQSQLSQLKLQLKELWSQSTTESKTHLSAIQSLNSQLQSKAKQLTVKEKQMVRVTTLNQTQKEQLNELRAKHSQTASSLKDDKLTIKNLNKQIEDKKNQISRAVKENERLRQEMQQVKKVSTSKLQQTEQELRNQLRNQQHENSTLKQTNLTLTKNNNSLNLKIKQLQTQLTHSKQQIQTLTNKTSQQLKLTAEQLKLIAEQLKLIAEQLKLIASQKAQIAQLKQTNQALENNKQKLAKDHQSISKGKKQSDQQTQRLKQVNQNQKTTLQKLTTRINQDDKRIKDLQAQTLLAKKQLQAKGRQIQAKGRQIQAKGRQIQAKSKEVESKSSAIKSLEFIKQNQFKKISNQLQTQKQSNKKICSQNSQLQLKLNQLQLKLNALSKQLQTTDKKNAIDTHTLQPIKLILNQFKTILTAELKAFDNFDNSKNKLLKSSTQKLDTYNEKNYNDFVRQFTTAINVLKTSVLSKLSDIKIKQKVIAEFSTINSLLTKWNWAGYA